MADVTPRVADLLKRFEGLKGGRGVWHSHWEDCARVMLPRRMGFTSQSVEGDRRTEDIFDGTPMQSARGLANAIGGILRQDGDSWFHLRVAGDDPDSQTDEALAWLADSEDKLRDALDDPKARFRQATGEVDQDLVVFGTAILFVNERPDLRGLMFQSVHLKDGYVFFGEDGSPQGLFRSRMLTLRQAENKFTTGKLSDRLQRLCQEQKYDDKHEFLHVVFPRREGYKGAILNTRMPYAEYWIEVQAKHEVAEGGFQEFPFIVPRWDTSSGEDYGRSPGMIALPDSNTLQAMGETLLIAGQRNASPPMAVPDDGAVSAYNSFPDGLMYYSIESAQAVGGNPFFPMPSGADIPLTREMQQDVRQQVQSAFFRNVFNLPVPGESKMTATEIIARKQEFIREIGPVFGRLESDYTGPMVERSFRIMLRANQFLPVPESLLGKSVRFEYESPVTKVRKQVEAAAAHAWVNEHIEAAAATGRMDILDPVNFDGYSRFTADANGLPHQIINPSEEVARLRQERAEQQQQAHQAQMAEQLAGAAKTAGEIPGFKQALETAGGGQQQPKKAA